MFPRTACTVACSFLALAPPASASDVVDLAASLIGRPYVWGAEGPRSFDCSGLTQYVFGEFGMDLPRRAVDQSETGRSIRGRLRRGDLVFFSTDTRRKLVTHVGIYEGNGVMVNASKRHGRVRRDDLDEEYWTQRFMFARRVTANVAVADDRTPPDRPEVERRSDARREAVRTIGRLAGVLLRRYPRQ